MKPSILSLVTAIVGLAGVAGTAAAAAPGARVAPCRTNPAATCAIFSGTAGAEEEVALGKGPFNLVDARAMGEFDFGGGKHRLAYVYGASNSKNSDARVFVVDLTAGRAIAWVAAPKGYGVATVWFDDIRSPGEQRRPFIAPGAHYLRSTPSPTGAYQQPDWDFLCLFDPRAIARPDPACGTGFTHYSTRFTTPQGPDTVVSAFRHGGGWVEDVDGDGWDDINLPFMRYILTLSGRTGKRLALAHFDVATQSEPRAPPYFHSGRFYGRFAAFTEPGTARHDVLFTDGEAVGYFGGLYCAVSRYAAVAQWRPGPTLALKWSDYLSFAKSIFKPPYNSVADVARRGDDLNKCPHFAGTGLFWLAGRPLVLFSLFTENNPAPACQQELLAEQRSRFAKDASAAYEFHCAPSVVPRAIGKWSIHILDAVTGKVLGIAPNRYLWGEAAGLAPGDGVILLVQDFTANGGNIAYNAAGARADALSLVRLAPGPKLTPLATLAGPLPVPAVAGTTYAGHYGENGGGPAYPPNIGSSYGGISRLVLRSSTGGEPAALRLADGRWLVYSGQQRTLTVEGKKVSR